MAGFLSGLLHSASVGAAGYGQGEEQAHAALLARLDAADRKRLQQAQIDNYASEAEARRYAQEHPTWHPSNQEEAEQFYTDTHPQKDTGPTPGSEEWYDMQDRVARIHAKYRSTGESEARSELIPLDKEITTIGQEIDDNRANLSVHDRDFKSQFPEGAPTRRPKTASMVPGFIADSTQAAGMLGKRQMMMQRDSSLNADRDKVQAVRRKKMGLELGLSPTKPTAGAGSDTGYTKSGVPPEAQALFDEAAAAYQSNPTPEAQAKYNRVVQAIARKYGLLK